MTATPSDPVDDARFAYRPFAVALVHPHAHQAAEAAEAADRQLRFWEMHALMLNTHRVLDPHTLLDLLRQAGLDEKQVQTELAEEVLRFEDLPLGSSGSRRAVVRWTDGSEGEGLRWFAEEILVCEGDHGNSRLMSSRVEMRRVAGSVGATRAT
jgi:hypothetical protein